METRWRFRTKRYGKGRQRFWDDVDMMTARGPDERTGRRRKCGGFDEEGSFVIIQTDADTC